MQLPPRQLRVARRTVLLVTPDGVIQTRGTAVSIALATVLPRWKPLWWLLRLPVIRQTADFGYCWIARNRSWLGKYPRIGH